MELPRGRSAQKHADPVAQHVQERFGVFLDTFAERKGDAPASLVYVEQAEAMAANDLTTLYVDFSHLMGADRDLAGIVLKEFYRFGFGAQRKGARRRASLTVARAPRLPTRSVEPALRLAVRVFMQQHHPQSVVSESNQPRDFWVSFYNAGVVERIRALKTSQIGHLVSISGTVVRTSEVRPELISGTFECGECGALVRDIEQQFKYTEPAKCPASKCENRRRFRLLTDQSKFVDWQRLRVQESSVEIPSGSMPRGIDIIARHDLVEIAKPGDRCVFTGTLVVLPDVGQLLPGVSNRIEPSGGRRSGEYATEGIMGVRGLGVRDLSYKLAFLATSVQSADAKFGVVDIRDDTAPDNAMATLEDGERVQIEKMRRDPHLYENLVNSIAPTIHGHQEIKRGILLMLFGGIRKETPSGNTLRGDINACIVGDPSTAKSQFLKCGACASPCPQPAWRLADAPAGAVRGQVCRGFSSARRLRVRQRLQRGRLDGLRREGRGYRRFRH